METQRDYNPLHQHLVSVSKGICEDNECTEDQHNCESYAYFNHDKETGFFDLATVCCSDYAQKSYDSYVSMPVSDDIQAMLDELDNNLIEA